MCLTPTRLGPRAASCARSCCCAEQPARLEAALKGCSEGLGGGLARHSTPWTAAPHPAECCCVGSVSPLTSVQSLALQGRCCHTGRGTQGCSLPHATPAPVWSWPPAAPKLPGLGTVAQCSPKQVPLCHQGWKAWTWVPHTLGRRNFSWSGWADDPTPPLLPGEPQAGPGWATAAFFPENTSLAHSRHGCAVPKGTKHTCPLKRGHISTQAGTGAGCPPQAGREWDVLHACPITGEPLVQGAQGGLCHAASPAPARRARSSSAGPPRPPSPPSSPARPGRAHGRRWC